MPSGAIDRSFDGGPRRARHQRVNHRIVDDGQHQVMLRHGTFPSLTLLGWADSCRRPRMKNNLLSFESLSRMFVRASCKDT